MGRPEMAADQRYATHNARGARQLELDQIIADWSGQFDAAPLLALLEQHDVPAGRTYRAPEMLADAHFKARESIVRIAHPILGQIAMQNVVPRLSDTPGQIAACGPELGQHNADVYGTILGFDEARLSELNQAGLI
jgi:formyl-CoA transferase